MNKEWQERFTTSAEKVPDAHVDEAGNIGFGSNSPGVMSIGSAADNPLPVLVELSRLVVIDIQGEDAEAIAAEAAVVAKTGIGMAPVSAADFLQDQVCNDLTAMGKDQAQINGHCTPKGRLLSLFTVFAHKDGFLLVLPDDVAPAFIKRLQMFVFRAKLTITHRTDLVCTGLVLDGTAQQQSKLLPEAFPVFPEQTLGLSSNDEVHILRWHDDTGHHHNNNDAQSVRTRYLCIGPPDLLYPLWQGDQFSHAAWPYWRSGDINAGIPNVFSTSTEQFIPLMLNMQLINALSFKKGCYPGQEIVARMYYLGKLKKHMKHLYQPGATLAPEPGSVLTTENNNNAGQVVDAVVDEHGVNVLAVVNINTPVSDLQLAGQGLQEAALPYSLLPVVDKVADTANDE